MGDEVLPFAKDLNLGALEVYKIEAEKVTADRQFKEIWMICGKKEAIYKRSKEDIPLKKPLVLCGPSVPLSGLDPVYIRIGAEAWGWYRDFGDEICPPNVPIVVNLQDHQSGSSVKIYLEHLTQAVQAHLKFRIDDDIDDDKPHQRTINITKGSITATTVCSDIMKNGPVKGHLYGNMYHNICRQRLKDAQKSGKKAGKKFEQTFDLKFWERTLTERPARVLLSVRDEKKFRFHPLKTGEHIPLGRSVVALPLNSSLEVAVDLTYSVQEPGATERTVRILRTVTLKVPEKPCEAEDIWIEPKDAAYPKVTMEVTWKNDYSRYRRKI